MVDSIGCYMVAVLDKPHRFTERGVRVAESDLWLVAVMPQQLSTGEMTGAFGQLQLYRVGQPECPGTWPNWQWNGNIERPTLSPSIGSPGMNDTPPTGWHGFLQDGQWKGC